MLAIIFEVAAQIGHLPTLAALAGIQLPVMGDHYCSKTDEVLVYQAADLSTIARKIEPGKTFGPIVDFSCYEETLELSPTCSEFSAGILVEFEDTAVDKTTGLSHNYRAFVKTTRNGEQICVPSSGPAKFFWDDAPPAEMSVSATDAIEDAPVTTLQAIAQLRSAGITLREETPGAESSIRRRDFPGPDRKSVV